MSQTELIQNIIETGTKNGCSIEQMIQNPEEAFNQYFASIEKANKDFEKTALINKHKFIK